MTTVVVTPSDTISASVDDIVVHAHIDGDSVVATSSASDSVQVAVESLTVEAKVTSTGAKGDQGDPGPQGVPGPPGINGDGQVSYAHYQSIASAVWVIPHNLGYRPASALVEDSAGTTIRGVLKHIDLNNSELSFIGAMTGTAYLS